MPNSCARVKPLQSCLHTSDDVLAQDSVRKQAHRTVLLAAEDRSEIVRTCKGELNDCDFFRAAPNLYG